jgi:hypothetical protein
MTTEIEKRRTERDNRAEAIKILGTMFALFPSAKMSEVAVKEYLRLLSDIAPADLRAAVDLAVSEADWLPTVGQIRKAHQALRGQPDMGIVYDDSPYEPPKELVRRTRHERLEIMKRYRHTEAKRERYQD